MNASIYGQMSLEKPQRENQYADESFIIKILQQKLLKLIVVTWKTSKKTFSLLLLVDVTSRNQLNLL